MVLSHLRKLIYTLFVQLANIAISVDLQFLYSDFHKIWGGLSVNPSEKEVRHKHTYRFENLV